MQVGPWPEDGPAEFRGDHDAHVYVEPQQEVQAAVPCLSDDAKHHGDGGLSDHYSEDEIVSDDKLVGQKTIPTKCWHQSFNIKVALT